MTHHVVVRGIERRTIFRDDRDRHELRSRLERLLPESSMSCLAWALMPNHFHLLLRARDRGLSGFMARLNTGYAVYFNRRHGRAGHLFQNRFHSIPVLDDAYLKTLVRYVHRNPLRAGIVSDLDALARHPWTGHRALLGGAARFEDVTTVLALFGPDTATGRRRLRAFMEEEEGEAERALGLRLRLVSGDARLAELARWACRRFGIEEGDLRAGIRRRPVTSARAVIAHVACDQLGIRPAQVAGWLGVTESAVHHARIRGRAAVANPPARSGFFKE